MKNFTNNFKQFTSRLSARWLIMALMLLLGTSSAWADMCIKGSWDNWNCHNFNDNTNYSVQLTGGNTYEFQIHDTGYNNDQNNNYGCDATMTRNSCTDYKLDKNNQSKNCKISADVTGTYIFKYVGWDNGPKVSVVYPQDPTVCETYTVAGTQGLCGANWDPAASKNDMKCNKDGTYTITFTGISAGKHEFKICKDHGWGTAYPSNNYVYEFTEEGTYDVTITFDKNNNNSITVSKTSSCTDPKASNFTYTAPENLTYNNETKAATVVWNGTQGGTITVKYSSSSTKYTQAEPKNVGKYYVYVTTTEANGMCGVTDLYIGKSFTITKANQTTPTITANSTNICGKEATFAVSGGESTGDYSYTLDKNDANATREGTTLKATQSGSVTLKVKKLGDINYNDSDEAVKEFNFTMPIENVTLTKVNDSKTTYCVGDRAEFKLTYSGPYPTSYAWSGTAMGSLEATGKTAKVLDNGASWYIDFSEAKTYTIALSLTGCNTDASDELSFTVNALPSAPTFTTNSAQVCSGVAFNLNEKFPRKSGEAGTLTWYKASDNSQVSDPTSVTITELTSYYAKATNNNCTSGKSLNCTVNVDTKPTLELASTPTVCPNVEIDLDDYATYNTGTLTWYSNQERTTVITNGLVTPTERTKYYATVINGTCNPVENEFTVDVYGIADDMPAYTSTPATSCKETPNSDGTITLKNPMGGVTYALDGTNDTEWRDLAAGTHTLSALVDACPSLKKVWDVVVEVEDITPTATVSITGESSFCEGDNTELTCEVETTGVVTAYQWYNGDNLIQGATESTYTAKAAGSYKVVVTVENKGCEDTFNATKEVSVKNKPTTPEFTPGFTSICVGGSTTLASGYNWYTELNASALVDLTVSPQTTTTYYATKVENGCTSDAGEFTVTVNPLPRITAISVNNSTPVINEDVLLTVEGSDIARVEWSITSGNNASLSDASGNSVKLTSTKSGAVTVTATAKSGAGCSATSTKEVTFKAVEECEPTVTTHDKKTKVRVKKISNWSTIKIYAHSGQSTGNWPGADMTAGTGEDAGYYVYTFESVSSNFKVIFNNGDSNGENQTVSGTATKGKVCTYTIGENSCKEDNNSRRCLEVTTSDYKTTTPAEITAPAVKTVSATSEEGSGIVTFTGKVLKTGCANGDAIWVGYQYKKANEAWPTTGVTAGSGEKQLVTITNNPGSEDFTVNVEGLGNGNYHFRAYIINGYNFTNGNYNQGVYYGLDKLVSVSTTKTPISNVTLNYCDEKGGKVGENPNPMCKGEFAYMKLDYQGSTASETKWLIDGEETTIVEETAVAGVYRFAISADVTISVKLRNDANLEQDGETPAYVTSSGLAYTMIDVPAAPYISINPASGVLCEGNTATITVTNPSPDCAYKLVGFTDYESGNLTYTVGSVGKYYVAAKHIACPTNEYTSNQVAINQIISTSAKISIEPAKAETTPWEPVSITVTADEGYVYEVTYTGNNLQDVKGVIIKQKGDTYTYYIPRPTGWGEGNAVSVRTPVAYGIKAQLKVDGEANQCNLSFDTATITVKDEEDEDCD